MQATAYCRIRYTKGDDFRRAERQRDVIRAMMDKAGSASVSTLTDMVNAVLPQVETSLNVNEILSVLGSVAGYNMTDSDGFPFEGGRTGANVGSKGRLRDSRGFGGERKADFIRFYIGRKLQTFLSGTTD